MCIRLRQATSEDTQSIFAIVNLLYLDIPNFVWNTKEFVVKQIANGQYFIAEEEDQPIGAISFRQRGNKMYIETLAVAKENQSNGTGTAMIEFAKEFTKQHMLNTLCACSFYEYQAKDFYLKQGFSLLGTPGTYNGHNFYRFEMEL